MMAYMNKFEGISFQHLEYTTIKRFNDAMADGMQLPALLSALTAAAEFDELPVRHTAEPVAIYATKQN
jgi:hypothetical protein